MHGIRDVCVQKRLVPGHEQPQYWKAIERKTYLFIAVVLEAVLSAAAITQPYKLHCSLNLVLCPGHWFDVSGV